MSAPPGKSGGAVSGAGPCAPAGEAHRNNAIANKACSNACNLTVFLPIESGCARSTPLPANRNWKVIKSGVASSQRRCYRAETVYSMRRGLLMNPVESHEGLLREPLAAPWEKRSSKSMAVRMAHALPALSCSNPRSCGPATSTPSTGSILQRAEASPWPSSRVRRPPERCRA